MAQTAGSTFFIFIIQCGPVFSITNRLITFHLVIFLLFCVPTVVLFGHSLNLIFILVLLLHIKMFSVLLPFYDDTKIIQPRKESTLRSMC